MFIFRVLHPEYRIPYLKLWSSLYVNRYRVDHVQDAAKAAELQAIKLENEYKVTHWCACVSLIVLINFVLFFVFIFKIMR